MRRIRWLAVGFAALQFGLYSLPEGADPPISQFAMGAIVIVCLVAINLISLAGKRISNERKLVRLGAVQLAADSALVLGIVWYFSFDPTSALWALLVVPVLEGSLRMQLRGALLIWAVASVAYVMRSIWAAATYPSVELVPESVSYRMGIILIVALGSGFLARSLREQMETARAARRESERRAELLEMVAEASHTIANPDAGSVLATVADTTVAIGFDGVEIALLDEKTETYGVMHTRGLPASYSGRSRPADSGMVGAVRRQNRTHIVADYASWPEGVPEVRALGYRAVVGCPIWCAGELMAVLTAGKLDEASIDADEVEALELLASQAGAALTNAKRFTERRTFEAELEHQAFHDPLTGLPNRLLFLDRLRHFMERTVREPGPLAVLFIDLDRFKKVNDSFGHDAGDQVLLTVSDRLRTCVRPADSVARFGGDEFTVLLEEVEGSRTATLVAQRILDVLREPFLVQGHNVALTASIGIAVGPQNFSEPRDFLHEADLAMYRAKELGGNRWDLYRPEMAGWAHRRLALESELRSGIKREELVLHYQPLVSLSDGEIFALEALVRWQHPEQGLLAPGEFIEVAEDSGLIVPVGRWALQEACRRCRDWQDGDSSLSPVTVCVNLSPRELRHPDFVCEVERILTETGFDPTRLVLEITEDVFLRDDPDVSFLMNRLAQLGIRLAVDDFGRRHAGFSYLKRFPFSILKIDRSFVAGLSEGPDDRAIVRAVLNLAQDLGLKVVAEGVEAADQLAWLRAMGCDLAQGFHLFEPVGEEDIPALLERRRSAV